MSEPTAPGEVQVCPDCKGQGRRLRRVSYFGKVHSEYCWTCGGTGQVKEGER